MCRDRSVARSSPTISPAASLTKLTSKPLAFGGTYHLIRLPAPFQPTWYTALPKSTTGQNLDTENCVPNEKTQKAGKAEDTMPVPTIFRNQDAEFKEWVGEHPRGLVVNVPTLMLHRQYCDHIEDRMTKAAKAWADGVTAESDLSRWARQTHGKGLLLCSDCEP
jgi:hypothetical protein